MYINTKYITSEYRMKLVQVSSLGQQDTNTKRVKGLARQLNIYNIGVGTGGARGACAPPILLEGGLAHPIITQLL